LAKSETADVGQYDLNFTGNGSGAGNLTFEFINNAMSRPIPGGPNLNRWHHYAITYDRHFVRFYYDGVCFGTNALNDWTFRPNTSALRLGCDTPGLAEYFNGKLDEIRIYNRALSGTEVAQLYALGGGVVNAVVSNVRALQRQGTKLVDITYDLTAPGGSPVNVTVAVSTNNGTSYSLVASSFFGSGYGAGVTPGNSRQIVWDAGADWNNKLSSQVRFRVTANGTVWNDSPSITVDTRDGNRPVVQDVRSAYCSGVQHAYFLSGISLNQTFTVVPNWNGKAAASIKFIGPWGTHTQGGHK